MSGFFEEMQQRWRNWRASFVAEPFLEEEIRKEQEKSEKIISLTQLVFFTAIGFLWYTVPKAEGVSTDIPVTPIVLGVYYTFIICRVYWAYKNLVNEAVVFISTFFDIAMLTFFIAAISFQYGQTLEFSLKAPTFLYYFVFIALRAFRHEMRYVLWTGVLSAISWSVLTKFVLQSPNVKVTTNFTEYGLPGYILLGAEVEKVIILTGFSVILSFVVLKNRSLLIRSVRQFRISENMSRFFSPDVVQQFSSPGHSIRAGTGRLRSAAILSIDIRGFSKISSQMSPNHLIRLLNDYQSVVISVVHKHGGSIDKFMGDGVLCHFGASKESSTYAADCLRCLDELQQAIADWNQQRVQSGEKQIYLGCAIAVGSVVFGAVGDEQRMEYTTIGEAVNVASKIEKMNKDLGVSAISTKRSLDLAVGQGYLSARKCRTQKCKVDGLPYPEVELAILYDQPEEHSTLFSKSG